MITVEPKNEKYSDEAMFLMFAMNDSNNLESVLNTFEKLIQSRLPMIPYQFPFKGEPCDWEKSINQSLGTCSSSENSNKHLIVSEEYVNLESSVEYMNNSKFKVQQKQEINCKLRVNLRSECIRKRIKSKFHGYILTKLNDFVKCESKDIFFLNAPKKLRVSVNLKFNQKWMSMTLKEAYTDLNATSSASERKSVEQNRHSFQKVKQPRFIEFINTSLKDIYQSFYESNEYKACLNEIRNSRGDKYTNRFHKVSEEFPNYYDAHSI